MTVPDLSKCRIIADNDEAKAFLLSENALSGLQPDPPYDTITGVWRSTDTHAYIFATFSRVKGDEGYAVVIFPWEHYTEAEAAAAMAMLQEANNLFPGTERIYYEDMEQPQN